MPRFLPNLFFQRKKPYRPDDDANLEVTPDYRGAWARSTGCFLPASCSLW